jgi:flagellar basal body-associated protein FliL
MLLRISLIVAIIAALAVGVLNFVMVKEKIVTLHTNWETEKAARNVAETERDQTKKELTKTTAELKVTTETLATTTEERDKAVTDVATLTKKSDRLTDELSKRTTERDNAQADLAAYTATGVKPEQIIAFNKEFKSLQETLAGTRAENGTLGLTIKKLKNELEVYKTAEYVVPLPPSLRGKVLVTDPKWNFVIINVGENQGVLEHGELLVNRDGKLVAKVKVRTVQKDRSIANVMPGWQLGEVLEGDQVIPANPAS